MLDPKWSLLKNGSDIRGVAESTAGQEINLTDEVVDAIAHAFLIWLCKKTNLPPSKLKISVGHDCRISGERISNRIINIFKQAGFSVVDCGLASTPAMFMTCVHETTLCHAAVQVTASHMPYDRNGLKFFTRQGGLDSHDIESILLYAQRGEKTDTGKNGTVQKIDFMSIYAARLVDFVRKSVSAKDYDRPLAGFHIVVDAGNGVAGFFVDKVLKPLGANTEGSQFLNPDGYFPNHIPNPEDKEAMQAIVSCVKRNNADLGIIFDTDVDRAGAVDRHGREINRNRLIALLSAILLEEKPGATIVTDSVTSSGLTEFIEKLGGVHHRFKRGYKNVINEAIRLNSQGIFCPLAIETSGHAAFLDNYFLDDGAYLVTRLLIKMAQLKKSGKTLESLISDLSHPAESYEFRMNISTKDFKAYGNDIIDQLKAYAEKTKGWILPQSNYEGVRVSFGKDMGQGWFLLRMSLHEPLMPLNIESDVKGGAKIIARQAALFLEKFDKLDTRSLKAFCEI